MAVTRLRTEVIVNLTVVVGAALAFSGILLLWLAEKELLAQQTLNSRRAMEAVAIALTAEPEMERLPTLARRLLDATGPQGWQLLDPSRRILAAEGDAQVAVELAEVAQAQLSGSLAQRLRYQPIWLAWQGTASRLTLTIPLQRSDGNYTLQAHFSLSEVETAMVRARQFFLTFLILYLIVLVAFGGYLLDRNVVRPVLALRQATLRVTDGKLDEPVPASGPAEIGELAGAFNQMMTSLAASRAETESSIASLQAVNEHLLHTRAELVRSEKLASVGRLAAGMAHEIGNPLGAVVGYLGFLQGQQPAESATADVLERSQAELARIDRLVRDLLDYAAPDPAELRSFDPVVACVEARDLLLHQHAFDRMQLVDELPASLPLVCMARHQLVQVLVNLLLNARDASAEGGVIRLVAAADNQAVRLTVSDRGAGIDPETLAKIFDPFFSTKAPGQGRGLGLAVSHRIVEEAGGRIEVASRAGEGSSFTVVLPCEVQS